MSNYTKIVDYAAKDALITGNPVKLVKGTELGAEYDAISVAIATKANTASPAFTGVSGFAVGAVGAPSIYITGYATTGWYNIGANNWGFAVSGAKVLDISSTGLTVVGISTVTQSKVTVNTNNLYEAVTLTNSSNTSSGMQILTKNGYGNLVSIDMQQVDNGTGADDGVMNIKIATNSTLATVASLSSTGLAVTGEISATGNISASSVSLPDGNVVTWGAGTTTYIQGNQASAYMNFLINSVNRMALTSAGLAVTGTTSTTTGMAVGGATAGAGGIAFPATAVAVADVNTLDDYEEGSFTPVLTFGGASVGITYAAQLGSYTKIGNRVLITLYVALSNKGSSTGQAKITGLPFTTNASENHYGGLGLRCDAISSTGVIQGYTPVSDTKILFEQLSTAGTLTTLTDANFANNSSVMVSLQYNI